MRDDIRVVNRMGFVPGEVCEMNQVNKIDNVNA